MNGDGIVGINDFLDLLAAWGPNPGHPADLNNDGIVGINDFLTLLANWGPCEEGAHAISDEDMRTIQEALDEKFGDEIPNDIKRELNIVEEEREKERSQELVTDKDDDKPDEENETITRNITVITKQNNKQFSVREVFNYILRFDSRFSIIDYLY